MDRREKDVLDRLATIITLIVSIAALLSTMFYGKVEGKSRWWVYAAGAAVIGLTWLAWFFFRRYKRKRLLRRIIMQRGDESRSIGFNGGLPYVQGDRHKFFGRDNDTHALTTQIKQEEYGLGVLYGESGVGKTSLIQAGIIPALEPGYRCIYVSFNSLSDSEEPLSFLLSRAQRELGLSVPLSSVEELTEKIGTKNGKGIVFFLDQFEQLFDRIPEQARIHFARSLQGYAGNRDLALKFILSVRADYFYRLYELFDLDKRFVYSLKRFNETQVREILRCTCGLARNTAQKEPDHPILAFEDELIADLRDEDGRIHPVEVSLICYTLMRSVGRLTRSLYLEGGRKQGWLDRYLDDVLQALPNRDQALQVLSSLISGDVSPLLSLDEIAARAGMAQSQITGILDYFEQAKLVVKEWSEA